MTALLEVRGLSKAFGGVHAVEDVSFTLNEGELLALIGPNGAGKTTCFNMLNGYLRPDAGTARLRGRDLVGRSPRRIWRMGVGRTFQITQTFASMTVRENVQMALASHHRRTFDLFSRAAALYADAAAALLRRVSMDDQAARPCSELAYGDLKRLELAIALAHDPALLLMDEPTAGMAPSERGALMALTAEIVADGGVSVLFTEHDMDVVFAHAHRIIVLNRGALIAEGGAEEIRRDPLVREVYLGGGAVFGPEGGDRAGATAGAGVLEIVGLNAHYGRAHILRDLSLRVGSNEVVALLGRNGAGKSTTMKSVIGLVRRISGRIVYEDQDVAGLPSYAVCRAGVGYVPEERRIFAELTVLENLEVGRRPPRDGAPEWTPERLFALFPNLRERRGNLGKHLSGGEQQMLTIARTLMGNPRLLLLDEPSEGIAPVIVEQMARVIAELKREGLSMLISEQNLHFARLVADRACIIEKGAARYDGAFADLDRDPEISRRYLAV